ncbi:MAG TPA: LacI family DNA-binding transcriptional regulator [Ktedonobacterales bacterium]|nr:LacI family DNA-binding transcriptional regulator [Ktedonobacterales bacterium]
MARVSGLSVATVSRVMHDSPRVSVETSLRVREVIERLGYTPNALARGLSMRVTHTIGVLVISISDPFWGEVVHGIEDRARRDRYAVLLASTDEDVDKERQALELFRHQRVDGIIIGASSAGPGVAGDRQPARLPLVFVNNEHLPTSIDTPIDREARVASLIATDDRQGARLAVEHLIALGHRRIAYIGPPDRASSIRRLQGYRLAMEAMGAVLDESLVMSVGEGANHGELAAFRVLARTPAPTALFCYDDMTALGALRAIRALKMRVPTDVSVIGYDDIPLAAYLDPPLTTVSQPMNEMGQQAMSILLDVLRGDSEPRTIVLGGELVVRGSSGPAPA